MRSTTCESPIQLLLYLSSPFRAGSRVKVVDAEEYKTNCPTVLGARKFFHFQIKISPRRARQSLSYFVNRQSRWFQENLSFFLFDFLDSFQTLKAQKDKKTQPRRKSENQLVSRSKKKATRPCDTPAGSSWRPLFDDQQDAPMPWWQTSQCPLKGARIRANFPDTIRTKKSIDFRPRRPGQGCRGT